MTVTQITAVVFFVLGTLAIWFSVYQLIKAKATAKELERTDRLLDNIMERENVAFNDYIKQNSELLRELDKYKQREKIMRLKLVNGFLIHNIRIDELEHQDLTELVISQDPARIHQYIYDHGQ